LVVGAVVHTKALNVTNYMEVSRFRGTLAKDVFVDGKVLEVVYGRSKGGRTKTGMKVAWSWLNTTKVKLLAKASIRAGPAPPLEPIGSHHEGSPVTQASQAGPTSPPLLTPCPAGPHIPPPVVVPASSPAVTTAHGLTWTAGAVMEPVGRSVATQSWSVRALSGEVIHEEGDSIGPGRSRKPYDYFMAMFPLKQMVLMVRLTSTKLEARGMRPTTGGELLKFIGVTVLATRYEFCARADLWATKARNIYLVTPAFGERTGLPRARFDALWSCLTFSAQSEAGGDSEKSRWQLVDDFVSNINEHRSSRVCPSELICVDESMCKWYGQGGNWIRKGLPMYVAIDRKPENGCEIQNAACGRSGIMLRLSVVTSTEHRQETAAGDNDGQPHGTAVIKNLVAPWAGTTRVVCADSYFASVATAQQLLGMGLRFIGVVKTATRGFPMASMSTAPLGARGEHFSYKHTSADGVTDLMAVVWVDRERRYFIASASSTIPGKPYTRLRWRQGDESAARVTLTVPQPQVAETYYCCCSQIDRHNRCRQDDLQLEDKIVTHDWSMRVNLSLLGMCIVDSLLLYSGARGAAAGHNQNEFYEDLAEQLIETLSRRLECGRVGTRGQRKVRSSRCRFATEWASTSRRHASGARGHRLRMGNIERSVRAGFATSLARRGCALGVGTVSVSRCFAVGRGPVDRALIST